MNQTITSNPERSLLTFAISKLNPDIFSHPVWIRFGCMDDAALPETLEELAKSAQQLQVDNPKDVCQLLLICAVYQNLAGRADSALFTISQVLHLAKQTDFHSAILWAHWGASAISCQQENFDQAASHLNELQVSLSEQNEWVLANFVDVIKQSLPLASWRTSITSQPSNDITSDDIIRFTFFWLQNWGFGVHQPEPYRQQERKLWHAPEFTQTGRTKLRGGSIHKKKEYSIWQSIRKFLHFQQYDPKTKPSPAAEDHHDPDYVTSPSPQENSLHSRPPSEPQSEILNTVSPQKTNCSILITVQMLGEFVITIQNVPVKIPASRGLSLFKYLLFHHQQKVPREVLMDIFWPDAEPEAARNNLNVAIYSLRQALRAVTDLSLVQFADGAYSLASDVKVWLDVREFDHCVQEGLRHEASDQLTAAVAEYEIAVTLYRGDFLSENLYDSWTVLDRERLRVGYLDTLDRLSQIYFCQERYTACITLCQLILTRDMCREDAHCRLMQCYSRLGQGPLALRQYQICTEALRTELDVEPAPETTKLYEYIRRREYI